MPRTVEKTVFSFDELSDSAKEKAREWYISGKLDYDWWEFVYEDAEQCGAILGIEIDRKSRNGNGPAIYFSGFYSQGDGACFEGRYSYAKGAAKKIRQHAPQDTELHKIADELQAIQRNALYRLSAQTKQSGHYNHSGCMRVSVWRSDDIDVSEGLESDLTDALRSFADWVYSQLESEYSWQNAEEQVDENIRANEYEFDEEGDRA